MIPPRILLFRSLPAAVVALSAILSPAGRQAPETRRAETIAPGVEHLEIRRGDFAEERESDRWIINVLVLDAHLVRLDSVLALDEIAGSETTSSLAARHGALAAVNGGYFRTTGIYRGEPTGMYAAAGKILSEPNGPRMEMAVSNAGGVARIAFSQVEVRAAVAAEDGERLTIDGINRPRGDNEIILFTPEFHRTTLTSGGGLEVAVRAGRVANIADGPGSALVPADGYALSASGTAREWTIAHLQPGTGIKLEVATKADPPLAFELDWVVGAGPFLVRAGTVLGTGQADAEGFAPDFSRARHPRTAIGVREDGRIVLAVVDGRQPKLSVGMTIPELASLMAEWGCREAINLDGGGSTTMIVGGKIVNHPSDAAGERPVSDAILVRVRR